MASMSGPGSPGQQPHGQQTSVIRPPRTFHQFPRLPPELRRMIWKEAIRPREVAGINYFTIYKPGGAQGSPLPRITVEGYTPSAISVATQNNLQNLHAALNLIQQSFTAQNPFQLLSSAADLVQDSFLTQGTIQQKFAFHNPPQDYYVRLNPAQYGTLGADPLQVLLEAHVDIWQHYQHARNLPRGPNAPQKINTTPTPDYNWHISEAIRKIQHSIRVQDRPEHSIAAPRIFKRSESAPAEYSWTKKNRSYALWDAGLLDSCWESREVMCEYLHIENRRSLGHRLEERRFLCLQSKYGKQTIMRPRAEDTDQSVVENWANWRQDDSIVLGRNGNAHLSFWINAYSDLYCFGYERGNMDSSMNIQWNHLIPQSALTYGAIWPANIGFEFHYKWNEGIPRRIRDYQLDTEATPRGLVARFWRAFCEGKVPDYVTLGLMDKFPSPDVVELSRPLPSRKVFSDLKRSWVEVEEDEVVYRGNNEVKSERRTAFWFKNLLIRRRHYTNAFRAGPSDDNIGVLVCLPPGCVQGHDGEQCGEH